VSGHSGIASGLEPRSSARSGGVSPFFARLVGATAVPLYRIRPLRAVLRSIAARLEGGEYHSATLRAVFERYHGVRIGLYTHGGCFLPYHVDRHTTIGRYSSFARTARIFNRDHPLERKSTHALFFNPALGYCETDTVPYTPLVVGNDVWIGHNAIIMPHVREIRDGAVIAAGAVVHTDVPPYAVVVGNPARVVRYRFPPPVIAALLEEAWWEKSPEELRATQPQAFFGES